MEVMIAAIKQGSLRQVGMLLRSGIKRLTDYRDCSDEKHLIELAAECGEDGIITKFLKAIAHDAESDPDTR